TGSGAGGKARHHEIPGARRTQSVRQHHRLSAAVHGFGIGDHLRCAESAHGGAAASAVPAVAGHVACLHHHPVAGRADGGGHAAVRPAADVDRSAYPGGPDPMSEAVVTEPLVTAAETRVAVATQRQLIWWRFRKHKLAVISAVIVGLFYLVALFADGIAYA